MAKKVLVLEDDDVYKIYIVERLKKAGYDHVLIERASEGVKAIEEAGADFVICDGVGWGKSICAANAKFGKNFCVYTADEDVADALQHSGIKVFLKGDIRVLEEMISLVKGNIG